jgi:hypothetical protein
MARIFAEANRVDEPFTAILDSEAYRMRLAEQDNNPELHNPLQLKLRLPEMSTDEPLFEGVISA